jgi:thiosulfate dehydrogenase [quinone] large subunit
MAGSPVVDWLFMLGLLGLGVALILGIGMRIASVGGALLMLLMWSSRLPPTTNPFLDQHIIYVLVLIGLAALKAGDTLGLGKWWSKLVNNSPVLQ